MALYLFALVLSFSGLLLMALLGLSHHHAPGKTAVPHHGHAHHGQGVKTSVHHHADHAGIGMLVLALFSPRMLLSVLLGFGAVGVFLHPWMSGTPVLLGVMAVIGGLAFERMIVTPFWNFLFGFASPPALTLDTLVSGEGEAATDFDADGHGLISVRLDGQVRQLLGTLRAEERAADAARVRTGERLFIRKVNGLRNTCTVSRLAR